MNRRRARSSIAVELRKFTKVYRRLLMYREVCSRSDDVVPFRESQRCPVERHRCIEWGRGRHVERKSRPERLNSGPEAVRFHKRGSDATRPYSRSCEHTATLYLFFPFYLFRSLLSPLPFSLFFLLLRSTAFIIKIKCKIVPRTSSPNGIGTASTICVSIEKESHGSRLRVLLTTFLFVFLLSSFFSSICSFAYIFYSIVLRIEQEE